MCCISKSDVFSMILTGNQGFALGIYDGLSGIVMDPIRGGKEEGAVGVAKGFGKGLMSSWWKTSAGGLFDESLASDSHTDLTNSTCWCHELSSTGNLQELLHSDPHTDSEKDCGSASRRGTMVATRGHGGQSGGHANV